MRFLVHTARNAKQQLYFYSSSWSQLESAPDHVLGGCAAIRLGGRVCDKGLRNASKFWHRPLRVGGGRLGDQCFHFSVGEGGLYIRNCAWIRQGFAWSMAWERDSHAKVVLAWDFGVGCYLPGVGSRIPCQIPCQTYFGVGMDFWRGIWRGISFLAWDLAWDLIFWRGILGLAWDAEIPCQNLAWKTLWDSRKRELT